MNWETLLAWGDSITIGARSYLAYPEYAGEKLRERTGKYWHTPIHAVCGYTATDLNRSLTPQMAEMHASSPSLLTIMIGTNDLKTPTDANLFAVAYGQVLVKARTLLPSGQILVLRIPQLLPGVMYPYRHTMNATVDRFNTIIDELAGEHGIRTVPVPLAGNLLYDGVHLNEVGSQQVGNLVAELVLADRGLTTGVEQ